MAPRTPGRQEASRRKPGEFLGEKSSKVPENARKESLSFKSHPNRLLVTLKMPISFMMKRIVKNDTGSLKGKKRESNFNKLRNVHAML